MTPTEPLIVSKKARYGYTLSNSMRFFAVYNKLLDYFYNPAWGVSCVQLDTSEIPGIGSVRTLQNRFCDGLKWLCDNHHELSYEFLELLTYKQEHYAALRATLKTCIVPNTSKLEVVFRITASTFKTAVLNEKITPGLEVMPSRANGQPQIEVQSRKETFKEAVQKFLLDHEMKIKEFMDFLPTEVDKIWLVNLVRNSPSIHMHWRGTTLILAKT